MNTSMLGCALAAINAGSTSRDRQPSTLPVYTTVTANGKKAVLINIARQPSSNTVAVADAVSAEITQLRQKLPQGVKLEPFYDQSQLVRDSISSVRVAIFIGLVLACIILPLGVLLSFSWVPTHRS